MNCKKFLFLLTITSIARAENLSSALYDTPANDSKSIVHAASAVDMQYDNEDLVDIINELAGKRKINIILPTGAQAINAQVTFSLKNPQTLEQAWVMLQTILDLAGYSMVPRENMYAIVKNDKDLAREPLKLYIGTPPEKLPDTDEKIRYLYYLANMKAIEDPSSELNTIFKELLPDGTVFKVEPATNSILIVEKARNIKAAMKIVVALDNTVFQETYEIVPLRHTSATTVAALLNDELLKIPEKEMYKYHVKQKEPEATFFSRFTRVVPEERSNSLIILGKPVAIERLKDLIYNEIDRVIDSGESVLHIYELQYLDAEKFAPILSKIVTSQRTETSGQSRAGEAVNATEKSFDGVIVKWDKPSQEAASAYSGGNRLIIAAKSDDWKVIKELIEAMDKPMPQVIIEILIADLSVRDVRLLGANTRNPASLPMPTGVDIQSAQLTSVVLDNPITPTTTLASDLLRLTDDNTSVIDTINALDTAPTVISFSDQGTGRTWAILEIVDNLDTSKVLSNPHMIATHNKEAEILVGEQRLLEDQATSSAATTTITKTLQPANLNIKITPRIFSTIEGSAEEATVNLDIYVKIEQYTVANTRENRELTTNVNVKSRDILALAGLLTDSSDNARTGTPILSQLPLIGFLFKKQNATNRQGNLTVFISPIVITPRGRSGVNRYTNDYINLADRYSKQGILFDQLRDPVTRFFFHSDINPRKAVDEFRENHDDQTKKEKELKKILEFADPHFDEAPAKPAVANVDKKKQSKTDLKNLLADQENPFATQAKKAG